MLTRRPGGCVLAGRRGGSGGRCRADRRRPHRDRHQAPALPQPRRGPGLEPLRLADDPGPRAAQLRGRTAPSLPRHDGPPGGRPPSVAHHAGPSGRARARRDDGCRVARPTACSPTEDPGRRAPPPSSTFSTPMSSSPERPCRSCGPGRSCPGRWGASCWPSDHAGSWLAWTVAAGVCTFGMAGQNAGSAVLLQMAVSVPVVLWWSARSSGKGWRRPLAVLGVLTGSVLALSAYWLLPAVLARGAGAAVVAQTESGEAISAVSSWSEVVRGLGLWPLYGTDGTTPWVEPHIPLITVPLVILAGFALLATAWWATATADRMRLRLAIGLTSVAALVMVGSHPVGRPTATGCGVAGRPGAGSRPRAAADDEQGRCSTRGRGRPALGPGCRHGSTSATTRLGDRDGRPRRRASGVDRRAVRQHRRCTRVLGAGSAGHGRRGLARCGSSRARPTPRTCGATARPDDIVQGLYEEREAMVRTTVANTTPQGASLLAGLDRRLQEGNLPPRALAAVSRYLGVGSLVVRGDVDNASVGGADPAVVAGAVVGITGALGRSDVRCGLRTHPGSTAGGCLHRR